ncbi:MAG: DUF4317 domain-containing protein [Clostridia bacterium]|nr:DUF4317 domain-containing protein [Clostridia bacterium]
MNRNEISEIRKRFNPDKNNITNIRGCYVDTRGEIISTFDRPLISMPKEEAEKYLNIFRKTLSGTPGRNLVDIVFEPWQVMESENHKALMALRETKLRDEDEVEGFFTRIISSLKMDENYLILMLSDTYDVPFKGRDDVKIDDASEEQFSYIVCAICPVKPTKPALSYYAPENAFHSREEDWIVGAPECGFMFPSFEERSSNIYKVVYYNRDVNQPHEEMTSDLFGAELPMAAPVQAAAFQSALEEALDDELSLEVVQAVNDQLREIVESQKHDKEAEAPTVTKAEVANVLEGCGVDADKIERFEERYDEEFGVAGQVPVANLVNRTFEVRTPDVVIKVAPDKSELIETRIIDGMKYILIRADEGVEVNGVNIRIRQE